MGKRILSDNYRIYVHKKFTLGKGYGYYAVVSCADAFHKWLLNPVSHPHPAKGHGFHKSNPLAAVRMAIKNMQDQKNNYII